MWEDWKILIEQAFLCLLKQAPFFSKFGGLTSEGFRFIEDHRIRYSEYGKALKHHLNLGIK